MSPEAQIRELLNRAETAVESRSISAVSPLLSSIYSNAAGQDKQAVMRLLAGYFVAHQSIHLLMQVSPIELTGEERARVTLFVAVAGEPVDAASQLLSLRADLIRLELELVVEEGEWRVLSGAWRRAETRDFLE